MNEQKDPKKIYRDRVVKRLRLTALGVMILLPLIGFFALNLLSAYYYGDIEHELLYDVSRIALTVVTTLTPFAIFGVLQWSVYRLGAGSSKAVIALAFVGIFLQYPSMIAVSYCIGELNDAVLLQYLLYTAVYIFDAAVLLWVILSVPLMKYVTSHKKDGKLKSARRAPAKKASAKAPQSGETRGIKRIFKSRLPREMRSASLCAFGAMLFIKLSTEIYYDAEFFWQLAHEYYRSIYPSELFKMALMFVTPVIFCIAGLFIMRSEMRLLDDMCRRLRPETKKD